VLFVPDDIVCIRQVPSSPPPLRAQVDDVFGGLMSDMQLLFSMVFNSTSFLNGNEHWIPLCLPKFNSKGFLHAYIWAEDSVAIILISADKNSFFNMREIKEKALAELTRTGIWEKVLTSVRRGRYTIGSTLHHTFFPTPESSACVHVLDL